MEVLMRLALRNVPAIAIEIATSFNAETVNEFPTGRETDQFSTSVRSARSERPSS